MDPYQRVEQVGSSTPAAEEHEIKIQTQSRIWSCVGYAVTVLEEKETNTIVLKAMGDTISRAVMIAEGIKKKTAGLHQNTSIGCTDEGEAWNPLDEDLLPSKATRYIPLMTITLSKKELDTSSPGYQSPVPGDQMKPLRELDNGGHDGHGAQDGHWRGQGDITEASDLNVNRGRDARCGYSRGWNAGRGRGRGRYQAFQGHGRGYSCEIGSDLGMENVHQESGNISEASDLSVNRGWDAGRGRGRGRYQAFQGRGRGVNGEIASDHGMENVHQESGNTSESSDRSVGGGWDAGYGRGRGHGRDQAFQGQGRGYSGKVGDGYTENMHQESGGQGNVSVSSDQSVNRGWDAGRGRGRKRGQAFQRRGRGYIGEIGGGFGTENMHQESGNINRMSGVNRGWDARNGCTARGRQLGRGRAFQGKEKEYSVEIPSGWQNIPAPVGWQNIPAPVGWENIPAPGGWENIPTPSSWENIPAPCGWENIPAPVGWENTHIESGNINGMPDLCLNRDWDARNDYAARGRGRGRDQASQGRGRQYGVEVAAGYLRENLHQESGNINGIPNLSMNRVWDSRNGCAGGGRGLRRDQGFQGRGRGYTGNMNRVPDDSANRGRDARHGYTGRARGRGRDLALRGRGRAYNTEIGDGYGRDNMQQESRGCGELDEQKEPVTQESVEQQEHVDNIETPVATEQASPTIEQASPTIDNLPLDSTCLSFDSLGDEDISRIGSACGFIFSGSGMALVRQLERQRAKLGFT